MAIDFTVVRDGGHFSTSADKAPSVPVGARVRYKTNHGLSNDSGNFGSAEAKQQLYKAADFAAAFPYWSDFIEPTAMCEGQSFISLNTYDRARFTFGFAQFAAHVAGGDFVVWFRDMLGRPEAADYFPDLQVSGGRIVKMQGTKAVPMEDAKSTEPLQLYFNPSLVDVDDDEVLAAGKLIHWTTNHAEARSLQVEHMMRTALGLVKAADVKLGLDGVGGDLCCVIMDVRHQGRGTPNVWTKLKAALKAHDPFEALLAVGSDKEPDRVTNLTAALKTRRANLAKKKWSRASSDFV